MSQKKKTDILKIVIGAALAAASVLFVWILKQPRFQNIAFVLTASSVAAFVAETAVLQLLKGKNVLKRIIKVILIFAVNISFLTSAVIYSFSPAIILQPHSDENAYSELQNISDVEEITFDGKNGKINGWFYNKAGESAPTVLYFYGNYETASTRLLQLVNNPSYKAFDGCNFAVFDYPSYGNSEGRCTANSLLEFSLDVYDYLIKKTNNIVVLGYSVGTGPAVYLASERDISALILYAPYMNGKDLYNNVIDIFHGPLEKLVAFDIESEKYAETVAEKTLILATETDELIPFASSVGLSEKFVDCIMVTAPISGHNDFLSSDFIARETQFFVSGVTNK